MQRLTDKGGERLKQLLVPLNEAMQGNDEEAIKRAEQSIEEYLNERGVPLKEIEQFLRMNNPITAELDKRFALRELLRNLPSNMIAGDLTDVQVLKVEGRDFASGQQPGGAGLNISFSISWHALGKTGKEAHGALDVLVPEEDA